MTSLPLSNKETPCNAVPRAITTTLPATAAVRPAVFPDLDVQPTQGRAATEAEAFPTDDIAKNHGHDQPPRPGAGEGRIVGLIRKRTGLDPVVGWLVCIAGPTKAATTASTANATSWAATPAWICISGDDTVSRNKHAILSFNPDTRCFKILPGEGRGIAYCNGEEVDSPRELQSHDVFLRTSPPTKPPCKPISSRACSGRWNSAAAPVPTCHVGA